MKLISIRTLGVISAAFCFGGTAFAHPGHDHAHANHRIYELPPLDTAPSIIAGIVSVAFGLAILGWAIRRHSGDS